MQQNLVKVNTTGMLSLKGALRNLGVKSAELPMYVRRRDQEFPDLNEGLIIPPGIEAADLEDGYVTTSSTEPERQEDVMPPPLQTEEEVDKLDKPPARVSSAMARRQRAEDKKREAEKRRNGRQQGSS